MRQKTLMVLAIVTVPVLAAAIFIPARQGVALKPIETGLVFPTLKDWLGSATKLTVTGAGGATLTMTRPAPAKAADAGAAAAKTAATLPVTGWVLTDKGGYPVQESAIKPVIAGLAALHEIEAKTERPKLYDRLEVEDPATSKGTKAKLIVLGNDNGANIVKLILGKRRFAPVSGGADALYVRKPEEERAWVAEPAFEVPIDALSWVDKKIIDIDPDKIKTMTITPVGAAPLVLEREKPGDKLMIRDLPKDATLRSETAASDVAAGFRFLDLIDVRPAAEVTTPVSASVDVVTTDGLQAKMSFYDRPNDSWLEVTAKGDGDAAKQADEIVNRTKGWAYKVTSSRAKLLESKLVDLLTPVKPPDAPADGAMPAPDAAESAQPEPATEPPKAPPRAEAPKRGKPGK